MKDKNYPLVSVIILNWNGWKDTIECLESLLKSNYPNFNVIIIDNGSTDASIEKIIDWSKGKIKKINTNFYNFVYPLVQKPISITIHKNIFAIKSMNLNISSSKYHLIILEENLGFAKGINLGIDFATKYLKPDFFYLLNNDTVIEKNALTNLVKVFEKYENIAAAQSTIYFYDNPNDIANAGGILLPWYQTKYYKKIKYHEIKRITFINGCAMLIPATTIKKYGKFTERFFFGEEDFEFSIIAKVNKLKLVVVESSKVYHKVANSSKKQWTEKKKQLAIFALNRIIDIKHYCPKYKWLIWKFLSIVYFFYLLTLKYKIKPRVSLKTLKLINEYSNKLSDLKKPVIEKILNEI